MSELNQARWKLLDAIFSGLTGGKLLFRVALLHTELQLVYHGSTSNKVTALSARHLSMWDIAISRLVGILWQPVGVWTPPCASDRMLVCSWMLGAHIPNQHHRILALAFKVNDIQACAPPKQSSRFCRKRQLPCMQASGRLHSCYGD